MKSLTQEEHTWLKARLGDRMEPLTSVESRYILKLVEDLQDSETTVAEAFTKAGWPVPEGAKVAVVMSYQNHYWVAQKGSEEWRFIDREDGFQWYGEFLCLWDRLYDLSRLPAADCKDALPSVVAAVLTTEGGGE